MRKIEATIDPWIVQDVREALARVGVTDIALCDVRCTDVHGSHTEFYRGVEYRVDLVPKLKLEVVVDDECVDDVVKAVTGVAVASVGRILIAAVERAATASAAPSSRWSFGARAGRIGAGSQDPAIAPAHSTGGPSAPTGLSSRSG
jgi:nitrogen regulatory protein P-II 1